MYILNGQNGKFCCVLPQLKKKNLKVQQNTEKLGAGFELLKFIHLVDCLILNLFLHSSYPSITHQVVSGKLHLHLFKNGN